MANFTLESTIKRYPKHDYEHMKRTILGERYVLSLVFVGKDRAQSLNIEYRNKSYVPNVLSFPLAKDAGEVFICPAVADTQAKKFGLSKRGYIAFLFIHALLHLKGHDHGDTMEKQERSYLRTFGIT